MNTTHTPHTCIHCGFIHFHLDDFAQVDTYGDDTGVVTVGHCGNCGFDQELQETPSAHAPTWQTGIVCPFCGDQDAARSPSSRLYCSNCGGE